MENRRIYNRVIKHPLQNFRKEKIKNYSLPDPLKEERFSELNKLIKNHGDSYFIGVDISGSIFEPACHLRGMEELIIDLATNNQAANIFLDKITEFTISVAIDALKIGIDWIWLGDDIGTQQSMLMSPNMWRKYLKPRLKMIIVENINLVLILLTIPVVACIRLLQI